MCDREGWRCMGASFSDIFLAIETKCVCIVCALIINMKCRVGCYTCTLGKIFKNIKGSRNEMIILTYFKNNIVKFIIRLYDKKYIYTCN